MLRFPLWQMMMMMLFQKLLSIRSWPAGTLERKPSRQLGSVVGDDGARFNNATFFAQDLCGWDVCRVQFFPFLFAYYASLFQNADLSRGNDVDSGTEFDGMFSFFFLVLIRPCRLGIRRGQRACLPW